MLTATTVKETHFSVRFVPSLYIIEISSLLVLFRSDVHHYE